MPRDHLYVLVCHRWAPDDKGETVSINFRRRYSSSANAAKAAVKIIAESPAYQMIQVGHRTMGKGVRTANLPTVQRRLTQAEHLLPFDMRHRYFELRDLAANDRHPVRIERPYCTVVVNPDGSVDLHESGGTHTYGPATFPDAS